MAKEGARFLHRYPGSIESNHLTSELSPNLSSSLGIPKMQPCLPLPQLHLSSPLLKYPPPSSCLATSSPAVLRCSRSAVAETLRAAPGSAYIALSPCPQQPLPRHAACWLPLPLRATFKRSEITSEIPPAPSWPINHSIIKIKQFCACMHISGCLLNLNLFLTRWQKNRGESESKGKLEK